MEKSEKKLGALGENLSTSGEKWMQDGEKCALCDYFWWPLEGSAAG